MKGNTSQVNTVCACQFSQEYFCQFLTLWWSGSGKSGCKCICDYSTSLKEIVQTVAANYMLTLSRPMTPHNVERLSGLWCHFRQCLWELALCLQHTRVEQEEEGGYHPEGNSTYLCPALLWKAWLKLPLEQYWALQPNGSGISVRLSYLEAESDPYGSYGLPLG